MRANPETGGGAFEIVEARSFVELVLRSGMKPHALTHPQAARALPNASSIVTVSTSPKATSSWRRTAFSSHSCSISLSNSSLPVTWRSMSKMESMCSGYWEHEGVEPHFVHSGGHAWPEDLRRLASALAAKWGSGHSSVAAAASR